MPRKKIESTIPTAERRWMSPTQAADYIGFSIEFFNANIRPNLQYEPIVFGKKDNCPMLYDRLDIDEYLVNKKKKKEQKQEAS